ncbi:hypothetical protein DUNSADRAFT_17313 [Dunaliella salina]|uniref:Encoded protein n=1 Tax=Dunaliella salina TaxID=3046 RepID=A0ABQ7G1Z6_DUNSA|nr:hypothetical protein DUNSADRAFT_17313 [Dunaliella salina]|eukprot:KAF5828624.1 hypothetical protein DUNSADRAFT_17313 [Dunaliella salina]
MMQHCTTDTVLEVPNQPPQGHIAADDKADHAPCLSEFVAAFLHPQSCNPHSSLHPCIHGCILAFLNLASFINLGILHPQSCSPRSSLHTPSILQSLFIVASLLSWSYNPHSWLHLFCIFNRCLQHLVG